MGDSSERRGAIYIHASDVRSAVDSGTGSGRAPKRQGRSGSRARRGSDVIDEIEEDEFDEANGPSSRSKIADQRRKSEPKPTPLCERQTQSATPTQKDGKTTASGRKMRGSINLQIRRPHTQPEPTVTQPRRMSIRRKSTLPAPPTFNAFSTPVQQQPRRPSAVNKEPDPSLTEDQKAAFKEAFDLFDRNGGGTIDAEELTEALSSVDIHLSIEEIKEVLEAIDKDGSGEIDFQEFLNIMTNTEKFLEMFASKHEGEGPIASPAAGRVHILFDALTQFMKSSALKAMDEIVGYYKNKYRRAPHVVMHYAAGARLIGLTEKQLARHLEKLQASNQGMESPYAQPLRIFLMGPPSVQTVKKKGAGNEPTRRPRCTGKIRLTVQLPPSGDTGNLKIDNSEGHGKAVRDSRNDNAKMKPLFQPRLGWTKPHVKSIAARLPQRKSVLTMEDLASIRKRITDATRDHYHDLAKTRHDENQRYWHSLQPQFIPSKTLRTNFRKVFCAYVAGGQPKI